MGFNVHACRYFTGTALAITLALAYAQSALARKWECGERSNLPIEGKNFCAAGDFRQTEINLAKLLDALVAQENNGTTSIMVDEHKAFEADREARCASDTATSADKPWHPMILAQCKTRLTSQRIEQLRLKLADG